MSGIDDDPELLAALRAHARGGDIEIDVGDGWLPLVRECHEAVVAEFPDYQLLAVKEKYAELAFQAIPGPWASSGSWSDEEHERIEDIIQRFTERSREICERCGRPGEYRDGPHRVDTLCDDCFAARTRGGLRNRLRAIWRR